ncbi:hypothetical protein CW751_04275 [Brumimicrobium salinarum]|uniref:PKD domain-containing protein n=1 Tax=Brumimicrobium salinarum TaxID=2058658 RepID=A0A2I0R575_9FLAO|nr:gliding motility-associated C-terminal domain-containing protein [Brumimicrobium salinarum]PKR81742.1 hypothetical protein CW751_04275 [Brumimicrobium salinarum]
MRLLLTFLLLTFSYWSYSQCSVTIETVSDSVDCGDCVDLVAVGVAQDTLLYEDFNNGTIGPGWSSTASVLFSNPCGPTLDGTPAAWFGDVVFPRTLITTAYDMTCGGDICFDLDFAGDDNSTSDCEDPDETDEGVHLDYSIDGGSTWVNIFYFEPTNNKSGPYYTWDNYCFTIPPAAQTTSTMFRWSQPEATDTYNDHWGIDNVTVLGNLCNTYYYDWDVDGITDTDTRNECITQNVQNYNVIFTDGVSDTCYAEIDMFGVIDPNLPNDTSFCGIRDTNLVSNPVGGSGTYDFLWNNGDTDNTIENVTTGIYYVDIVDGTYPGCTASDTIDFGMHPIPNANFVADPLCQGVPTNFIDSTELPPGFDVDSWYWNFDNQGATSTEENPSFEFSGVGFYDVSLSVETIYGCVDDTTINIFVEPSPYALFDFDNPCEGEEVTFTNESLGNFENSRWIFENDPDTIYSTDATYTFDGSGNYDVTLIVDGVNVECNGEITQTVNINPAPDVSFTANPMIGEPVLDVTFYQDASNLVDNFWDFADGNTSNALNDTLYNSFLEAGSYDVVHTGTDANGCSNTFTQTILVEFPDVVLEIPNIVTPNGDNVNDGFYITYLSAFETITDFEIVILNRWGNVIQTFDDPNFVWDGKNKAGNPVSDGTFFYKLNFETLKGASIQKHGFVQVVNE